MAVPATPVRRRVSRAFTLIELLIVITVVAMLALIVIPRAMAATRRSKESQLRGNLKQIRDAVERFEASTGAWPPQLTDVVAANGAAISGDFDGSGGYVDRSAYDGPYAVPGAGSPLVVDPFTGNADWHYDNATGAVHSSSTLIGTDGMAYDEW